MKLTFAAAVLVLALAVLTACANTADDKSLWLSPTATIAISPGDGLADPKGFDVRINPEEPQADAERILGNPDTAGGDADPLTGVVHDENGYAILNPTPDFDLSKMGATMAFASLYDMAVNPANYRGKTVRLRGRYSRIKVDGISDDVDLLVLTDLEACCQINVRIQLAGNDAGMAARPQPGEYIEVTGIYGTFTYKVAELPLFTVNEIEVLVDPKKTPAGAG